ncbi:MAG: hypothetical protein WAZ60_24065 [Desulfosalsimonadaceae bacterium]
MIKKDWTLSNIPPKDDPDVADFAQDLFEIALAEKERLGKPADFLSNYALYRGRKHRQHTGRKGFTPQTKGLTPINLYFANVERTVSNITARNPTGEVVDMDGLHDGSENILSMELKKWWKDTGQQDLTKASAKNMEIYGCTPEKPSWDKGARKPAIAVMDVFQFLPAPGNWSPDEISTKCPYICFAYLEFVSEMEDFFSVKDISPDEAYDLMGTVREEYKPQGQDSQSVGNYADPMSVRSNKGSATDKKIERCLVIEVWVRDGRIKNETVKYPATDQETGQPLLDAEGKQLIVEVSTTVPVYRDGVRKITITKTKSKEIKSGVVVLDDCENPNINPALPTEIAINTYPWGKLPIYFANSYKDGISIWGFAASEQVGDLLIKINLIVSKLIAYVLNVMAPPLIVQQHCGITREMIESSIQKAGRLILMPSTPNARIEFMQIPNLPETFFRVLDLIITLFDRVYAIEEVDRGNNPAGVRAASAIVALQERNQVLMQTKTSAIDSLVEQRSRWAIGLWQNHGTNEEFVDVAGEAKPFVGTDFAGRKFNFVVESGSMTPKTSLQLQEDAKWLYMNKAIGQRGLLETLNYPNWKEEIERTAESQIDQALQIIVDAGLPMEAAVQIRRFVMESSIQTTQKGKQGGGTATQPASPPQAA